MGDELSSRKRCEEGKVGNISWSPVFVHLYALWLAPLMDKCVQWLETQTWDWWVGPLRHSGETLSCYLLNFFFCLVFSLLSSWDSNYTYVRPLWSCYKCLLCSVLVFILFAPCAWVGKLSIHMCLSSLLLSSAVSGLLLIPSIEFWISNFIFSSCKFWFYCCCRF